MVLMRIVSTRPRFEAKKRVTPGAGRGRPGPGAPAPRDKREEGAGSHAERQYRPEPGAGQRRPPGGEHVADEADQGIERRVPVRLLAGERPEPGKHPGVEQELR